jgi:alpha-L-fucosidase
MLADVVAKGGNLLLNIGPGPDGTWHDEAYDRLEQLGAWLRVNGEAIYGTRPVAPHVAGKLRLTRGKDGAVYVLYLLAEGVTEMPHFFSTSLVQPADGATISLLGGGDLDWQPAGAGFEVEFPDGIRSNPPSDFAWVLKVSAER